jgi:nicotinate-nucleotide adenylyltransferase
MKRIGLFGGSFDPVHNAHVALAKEALERLPLDEVRWVPAGQPWQKTRQLTSAARREAMVNLAMAGEPRFKLETCELRRRGPSFTLDTVRELQTAQPGQQWFLIIGQDQYTGLHTWRDWRELVSLVTLVVAKRPGATAWPHPDLLRAEQRAVPLPMMAISSTDIRERVAQGLAVDDLVPASVARYIEEHRLYPGPNIAGQNTDPQGQPRS